jgi:hypothetical protein
MATVALNSVALSRPGIGASKLTPKSFLSIVVVALNDTRVAPKVSVEKPFTLRSRRAEDVHRAATAARYGTTSSPLA